MKPLTPIEYINKHKVPGALLREFAGKKLWSAALDACENEIEKCKAHITHLKKVKKMMEGEK